MGNRRLRAVLVALNGGLDTGTVAMTLTTTRSVTAELFLPILALPAILGASRWAEDLARPRGSV